MSWTATNPAVRLRLIGTAVATLLTVCTSGARAQTRAAGSGLAPIIAEAAQRFALPPSWITGVMRRESGFQLTAVSRAGALGLMQIMPATYGDLQRHYGLGADPLQPRDNILAGAAYLRELYDRFGADGFLAAYNAGPQRYMRSLLGAGVLPAETRSYVQTLRLDLGLAPSATPPPPSVFIAAAAKSPAGLTPNADGLFPPLGPLAGGSDGRR